MSRSDHMRTDRHTIDLDLYKQGSMKVAQGAEALVDSFMYQGKGEVLIVNRKPTLSSNNNPTYISYHKVFHDFGDKAYDLILCDQVLADKKLSKDFIERVHRLLRTDGVLIIVDKFAADVNRSPLGKFLNAMKVGVFKRSDVHEVLKDLSLHFELGLHVEGNFAGDRHVIQMRKIVS